MKKSRRTFTAEF